MAVAVRVAAVEAVAVAVAAKAARVAGSGYAVGMWAV